jgi:hypothetical protein
MINTHRRLAAVLVGGLALLTLAACAGSGSSTGGQAQAQPSRGASGQAGGQGGQYGVPGVSGLIVSLSGKTMQVRTTSGQSTVTYTSKTTVTEQKSAKATDAKVGVCATVRSADSSASAGSSSTAIAAGSVSLSDEVEGSCQGGFGGGSRPSGMPSGGGAGGVPSGQPSGAMPSGAPRGGFGGASGKITKVDGSTLTIEQTRGTDKTSVTVTLTGDTTYTKQAKTDTDAIAKGKCVFARGKSDSTGALSATALRLSAATNGECQLGGQGRRNPSGGQSSGG